MESQLKRYHGLGLQQSFSRSYHYAPACKELALILKLSYSEFPKTLQSLVFQDVITAFRLLPTMQTQTAVEAANTLLQAVESSLPKQKKAQAVTKFKNAMVAHKRFSKAQHNKKDLVELPQDLLVHVFSFLDLQSLFSSSQVCRSWSDASNDNRLWKSMYKNTIRNLTGDNTDDLCEDEESDDDLCEDEKSKYNNTDWKGAFEEAFDAFSWEKLLLSSSRAFCMNCHAIFWVSDIGNETYKNTKCEFHQIKPISTRQIVDYIDGEYDASMSEGSDDVYDSEDDGSFYKLWSYPKLR